MVSLANDHVLPSFLFQSPSPRRLYRTTGSHFGNQASDHALLCADPVPFQPPALHTPEQGTPGSTHLDLIVLSRPAQSGRLLSAQ